MLYSKFSYITPLSSSLPGLKKFKSSFEGAFIVGPGRSGKINAEVICAAKSGEFNCKRRKKTAKGGNIDRNFTELAGSCG